MAVYTLTATIQKGQSLSNAVNLANNTAVRLIMPDAWDFANVTFQGSSDNITFRDLFDGFTGEIILKVEPGTMVLIGTERFGVSNLYMKIRSGNRQQPVAQSADRVFQIITDTSAVK